MNIYIGGREYICTNRDSLLIYYKYVELMGKKGQTTCRGGSGCGRCDRQARARGTGEVRKGVDHRDANAYPNPDKHTQSLTTVQLNWPWGSLVKPQSPESKVQCPLHSSPPYKINSTALFS